ncbi:hypothetical protein M406DRAFT_75448 [Cryphonectria parasitica EP155]|uniref:Uncharacterized protein n=1 Tax=Cryphonectria parasitica (strain ATCC 38755 / EP155) TaxID=660469 RepID=A0A9P4XSF1_CRYP1|nr:uncharacterized protein M406DRAFT_75448 [Cryphonectria parasitica EP155]KAF3760094.1 hypothetical protein M406DRAFT_75448 [Cryphonectria parasitica EP155]
MGLVHPLHIIATIKGLRCPIACIHLSGADPGWHMLQVISRILTYLKKNPRYIDRDLAYAEMMADGKWRRDVETEEEHIAAVPRFPFIHTCLFLGAVSSDWWSYFLNRIFPRPWNSAPNWGGKHMWEPGCTVIDLTDYSYAFVLPAYQACGTASKRTYRSLRLRPLDGHQCFTAFGKQHDDPERDGV